MRVIWTQHIKDEKKKEDFRQLLKNSTQVLGRLRMILDEEEKGLDTQETTSKDFDNPNWQFKQAFRNGDRARLRQIRNLIDLTEKGDQSK